LLAILSLLIVSDLTFGQCGDVLIFVGVLEKTPLISLWRRTVLNIARRVGTSVLAHRILLTMALHALSLRYDPSEGLSNIVRFFVLRAKQAENFV